MSTENQDRTGVLAPPPEAQLELLPTWEACSTASESGEKHVGAHGAEGICASCPMKDCPTRGFDEARIQAVLEAEQDSTLSPAGMVFYSGLVFVFPLICAVLGICAWHEFLPGWGTEALRSVLGALTGFVLGLICAQVSIKLMRVKHG